MGCQLIFSAFGREQKLLWVQSIVLLTFSY